MSVRSFGRRILWSPVRPGQICLLGYPVQSVFHSPPAVHLASVSSFGHRHFRQDPTCDHFSSRSIQFVNFEMLPKTLGPGAVLQLYTAHHMV